MSSSDRGSGPYTRHSRRSNQSKNQRADYQRAMDRLDAAVRNLGDVAKDSLADRAAIFLEDTTARLKQEIGEGFNSSNDLSDLSDRAGDDQADSSEGGRKTRRRGRRRSRRQANQGRTGHWRQGLRSTRPVRDLDNKRIWGICAGIAPYLGWEVWVVRCVALTGLVFMSSVIVPAYLIGYFVLDPVGGTPKQVSKRAARGRKKSQHRSDEASRSNASEGGGDNSLAPGPQLRSVQGTLAEAELRLRRMEHHVTSSRFQLQRELNKIDA